MARLHIYFNDDVLYFFGSKANLFQLSFYCFISLSRILFTIVVGRIKIGF
jgi:putative colanic acid biosynthesis UDP-glucose lipid carrier transferase